MASNKVLRVFHCDLAVAAEQEFGRRCPCCDNPMIRTVKRKNPTAQNRRDRASVAHAVAVSKGGNPIVWIWACRKCNQDQGWHSFDEWAALLRYYGDPRAGLVARVAAFVQAWCAARDVPLVVRSGG